ncbi:MAG TPA: AAA-like domain-containing protein [Blastocatellia bacterium]|nr:AAA-like domain-containing protein [Blastocatellia bacterium]HMX29321.1 AAA-like domain-containing protein [Blastocatellia bacterium]HMY71104.1 AAA-like domain-containing protein [Blastocatellia bacterium]HMZ19689.1 AAA-like domain-containing protein [Blastocatellia bacterium]HNG34867.1 AAA-like domain-containing protein [Blastocatellia bacterium]
MAMTPNPFTNRGPVTNSEDFFGRKDELATILTRLHSMQCASVVGERRIGKSSLLYHLAQTGAEQLDDRRYRFLYCSLQDAHYQTLQGFCSTILRRLNLEADAIQPNQSPNAALIAFTDLLESLAACGERVILCLDEFEETFKRPAEFGNGFFEHLRSQLELGKFVFVTASREPLQKLKLDGKLTSPFDNIFTKVELGDFTDEEAAEFIAYYDAQVQFTDAENRFIASYFELHPLRLRILCDQVLTNRRRQLADWALAEKLGEAYGDFFPDRADEFTALAKRTVSADNLGKWLGLIKQARDLFTGKGDDKK